MGLPDTRWRSAEELYNQVCWCFYVMIQSYDHTILFTVYSLYTWLTVGLGLMFPLLWLLDINCLENDSCFPSYPCSQRLFQGWQISWSHDLQILWIGDLHSFWSEAQGFVASLPLPARVWREGSTRFSKVLGKPMCTGGSYMIICQDTGWAFFQLLSKKESMLNLSSQKLLCSLPTRVSFVALGCSGAQENVHSLLGRSWGTCQSAPSDRQSGFVPKTSQNQVVCHFPHFFDDHTMGHFSSLKLQSDKSRKWSLRPFERSSHIP